MMYWLTWALVKIAFPLIFPYKVFGLSNIPRRGAFILASNHKSNIDPMLIPVCCTRRMGFVAKEELFEKKFLGWLLPQLGAIPIRRGTADVSAIKTIIRELKHGKPMVIFPEGTRTLDPSERKIQAGIGFIVAKSQVPVVPVYIEGTDHVMPPGAKSLKRYPVTVTFGPPLDLSAHQDLSYDDLAAYIMEEILSLPKHRSS